MLKKLLITLKYGESKVKTYLIGVIVLLIVGFILLVLGISEKSLIFLGTGAVLLIAGLLVMFSFSFVDIDVDIDKKIQKKEKNKKEVRKEEKKPESEDEENPYENMDIDFSMLEEDLSDLAIGVDGLSLGSEKKGDKNNNKNASSSGEQDLDPDNINVEEILKDLENDEEFSRKLNDNGGYREENTNDEDTPGSPSRRSDDDLYEVKKPTPKQIKARKKMLKVRKDDRRFTPIFVDTWREARVLHTPAFVQDKGKTANIVLVEGALRTELIPMSEFLKVTYQRGVEEKFPEEVENVKNDPEVNAIFGELLPALYQGGSGRGGDILCKNLYWLGGKIAITPRSLRKLFNKFDFEFHVFDSLDIKGRYSKYFKEAYESRIFWTDNVISQNDYQERIRRLLQSMVDNKDLKTAEFEADLDLMVRYNLITKEYSDYYKARKNDNIKIRI